MRERDESAKLVVLATSTQSAADHIGGTAGIWRRPDGAVVSFTGLDATTLDVAINVSAAGNTILGPTNDALFGAASLTSLGDRACADWTDSASSLRSDTFVTSTRPFSRIGSPPNCSSLAFLMCAQLP